MVISSASLKYARALAGACADLEQQDQVRDQLGIFDGLLSSHQQLRRTFSNPTIPFSVKREIVQKLGERLSLNRLVVNLLCVLLENDRIHQFRQMMDAYQVVLEQKRGILTVDAYCAEGIESSLKQRLEETIFTVTGKQVKFRYHVDESLVGGIKLRIGSTIIDGSIQTQLAAFRQQVGRRAEYGD